MLDAAERPHISYFRHGGLNYAHFDGSSWQIEAVDSAGRVGEYTSMELDASDRPHISYYDASNDDLKYAHFDGDTWQLETVDSIGDVGWYTSLELDASDRPHISYYDATNGNLKYAHFDSNSWQLKTVDSAGDVGEYTSLALDTSGQPHFSYYDATNSSLKYAAPDQPPVADAGADQLATINSIATLDGNSSSDPDGDPLLSFLWTQTAGPPITLSDPAVVSPTFTTPPDPAVLVFSLVVTDSVGVPDSTPDEVIVTVDWHHIYLPLVQK